MTAMIGDSFRAPGKGKRPARSAAEQASGEIGDICARRRLAQADQLAGPVLTPLLDGPGADRVWMAAAFLLGAIARDTFGDPQAAERALQHALDVAGPEQVLSPLLSDPSPGPPGRQDRHPRADGTLIGPAAALLAGANRPAALPGPPAGHLKALTASSWDTHDAAPAAQAHCQGWRRCGRWHGHGRLGSLFPAESELGRNLQRSIPSFQGENVALVLAVEAGLSLTAGLRGGQREDPRHGWGPAAGGVRDGRGRRCSCRATRRGWVSGSGRCPGTGPGRRAACESASESIAAPLSAALVP